VKAERRKAAQAGAASKRAAQALAHAEAEAQALVSAQAVATQASSAGGGAAAHAADSDEAEAVPSDAGAVCADTPVADATPAPCVHLMLCMVSVPADQPQGTGPANAETAEKTEAGVLDAGQDMMDEEQAAIKIQAALRGHMVRKAQRIAA
jgi:hypothetical protein